MFRFQNTRSLFDVGLLRALLLVAFNHFGTIGFAYGWEEPLIREDMSAQSWPMNPAFAGAARRSNRIARSGARESTVPNPENLGRELPLP